MNATSMSDKALQRIKTATLAKIAKVYPTMGDERKWENLDEQISEAAQTVEMLGVTGHWKTIESEISSFCAINAIAQIRKRNGN